jgi:hypothetical protein
MERTKTSSQAAKSSYNAEVCTEPPIAVCARKDSVTRYVHRICATGPLNYSPPSNKNLESQTLMSHHRYLTTCYRKGSTASTTPCEADITRWTPPSISDCGTLPHVASEVITMMPTEPMSCKPRSSKISSRNERGTYCTLAPPVQAHPMWIARHVKALYAGRLTEFTSGSISSRQSSGLVSEDREAQERWRQSCGYGTTTICSCWPCLPWRWTVV